MVDLFVRFFFFFRDLRENNFAVRDDLGGHEITGGSLCL